MGSSSPRPANGQGLLSNGPANGEVGSSSPRPANGKGLLSNGPANGEDLANGERPANGELLPANGERSSKSEKDVSSTSSSSLPTNGEVLPSDGERSSKSEKTASSVDSASRNALGRGAYADRRNSPPSPANLFKRRAHARIVDVKTELTRPPLVHQQTLGSNPTPISSTAPARVFPGVVDVRTELTRPLLVHQQRLGSNLTSVAPAPSMAVESRHLQENDDTWDRMQILYVLALGTLVGLVFLVRPILPPAYDRLILLVIAAIWGVCCIGLPFGLYGTSRWERDCSRHLSWILYTFFSVLVVYCFYLLAVRNDGSPTDEEFWWTVCFTFVGVCVLAGAVFAWIRGCYTGGDRDILPL